MEFISRFLQNKFILVYDVHTLKDVTYMYMPTSKRNNKGFSLVELMIVVSVIGVLATISIPMYSRLMLKAYSTEAKVSLSNLYIAQIVFFQEYNAYHSSLDIVGFTPPTRGRYNIGFGSVGAPAGLIQGYNASLSATQVNNISSKAICGGYGNGNLTNKL